MKTTLSVSKLAATAGLALAVRVADTLIVNVKGCSVNVRTIEGNAYVKMSDLARAFDMSVQSRGTGRYELIKAGGANQVSALSGKIGDVNFEGKWRFSVIAMETPDSFIMKTTAEPNDCSGGTSMGSQTRIIIPARGFR